MKFEIFMFAVLIINTIIIIAMQFNLSEEWMFWLEFLDNITLIFYTMEVVVKILGFGVEKYFEDSWNVFDFLMVIISFATIGVSSLLFNF